MNAASTTSAGQETPAIAERVASAQKAYAEMMAVGFEQARQSYEKAQQAFAQDLQSLNAELGERSQQAYRAYAEVLQSAYTSAPSYEACANEYRAYLEQLQELYSGNTALERQKAAYEKYVQALGQGGDAETAAREFRDELATIWSQQTLREALEGSQGRYRELLERLSGEARQRQNDALRDLLQQLGAIWSQPEIEARTQGAVSRLTDAMREVLIQCHATVEKSSGKAAAVLGSEGS